MSYERTTTIEESVSPTGTPSADAFWRALDDGRLLVCECRTCGHRWWIPMDTCPKCASATVGSEPGSRTGRLYSWSVIHRAVEPSHATHVPYVVGLVVLDDGTRVNGRVVGIGSDGLSEDMALQLHVTQVDGRSTWYFTAIDSEGGS